MTTSYSGARPVLLALLSFLVALPAAIAHNPRGTLRGVVEDATGARVKSAKVALRATESSQGRDATTDTLGEFRMEDLAPGRYRVQVNAAGFAEASANVNVIISSVVEITVKLKPAALETTVKVE